MICVIISVAHLGRKLSALNTLMFTLSSLLNSKLQSAVFDDVCTQQCEWFCWRAQNI